MLGHGQYSASCCLQPAKIWVSSRATFSSSPLLLPTPTHTTLIGQGWLPATLYTRGAMSYGPLSTWPVDTQPRCHYSPWLCQAKWRAQCYVNKGCPLPPFWIGYEWTGASLNQSTLKNLHSDRTGSVRGQQGCRRGCLIDTTIPFSPPHECSLATLLISLVWPRINNAE